NEFGQKGPQIRGFGFLHDGSVDRLFHFHRANLFDLTETEAIQMEQFMMAFDTDFAPIVGQQITLTSTSPAVVGQRIALLIARAAQNECDLVVKGNLNGVERGWVRQASGMFKSDRASDVLLTDAQLRGQVAAAQQERTYTCVPFGSGTRIGIDRDLDGCLNFDDGAPTNPLTCAGAGTTTTTSTQPGGTTTTTSTLPGGCTPVPVVDPRASVRVTTRNAAGKVTGRMLITLAAYAGEPVTVSLSDSDTPTIASQSFAALPAQGTSGRKWQFKTLADGVQKVTLQDKTSRQPNTFKVSVNAKHWFTAAAANQLAADTNLTVRIGNLCFTHVATKKTD